MADHSFKADPGSLEIVSTYVFDAPRERVFEAFTDPALIPKWWGVSDEELTVEKMEVTPGGSWRFVMKSSDGSEFQFRGVYHDVVAPEKLITTWQYEGAPSVMLETVTFEEQPEGKTKVTDQLVFQSLADREAMLAGGMDGGSNPMMERLAKLIA